MVHLRAHIEAATQRRARSDYRTGYAHGAADLNPPNPDELSADYWRGYSAGQRDAYATRDYYPDAHEGRGF